MKDHKRDVLEYSLSEFDGTFAQFLDKVESIKSAVGNASMIDAVVEITGGYDGFYELAVSGWVPMTEAEKKRAALLARRKREDNAKAKAEKEAAERAEYERLKAKFEEES